MNGNIYIDTLLAALWPVGRGAGAPPGAPGQPRGDAPGLGVAAEPAMYRRCCLMLVGWSGLPAATLATSRPLTC
jgi:hypothetical protein